MSLASIKAYYQYRLLSELAKPRAIRQNWALHALFAADQNAFLSTLPVPDHVKRRQTSTLYLDEYTTELCSQFTLPTIPIMLPYIQALSRVSAQRMNSMIGQFNGHISRYLSQQCLQLNQKKLAKLYKGILTLLKSYWHHYAPMSRRQLMRACEVWQSQEQRTTLYHRYPQLLQETVVADNNAQGMEHACIHRNTQPSLVRIIFPWRCPADASHPSLNEYEQDSVRSMMLAHHPVALTYLNTVVNTVPTGRQAADAWMRYMWPMIRYLWPRSEQKNAQRCVYFLVTTVLQRFNVERLTQKNGLTRPTVSTVRRLLHQAQCQCPKHLQRANGMGDELQTTIMSCYLQQWLSFTIQHGVECKKTIYSISQYRHLSSPSNSAARHTETMHSLPHLTRMLRALKQQSRDVRSKWAWLSQSQPGKRSTAEDKMLRESLANTLAAYLFSANDGYSYGAYSGRQQKKFTSSEKAQTHTLSLTCSSATSHPSRQSHRYTVNDKSPVAKQAKRSVLAPRALAYDPFHDQPVALYADTRHTLVNHIERHTIDKNPMAAKSHELGLAGQATLLWLHTVAFRRAAQHLMRQLIGSHAALSTNQWLLPTGASDQRRHRLCRRVIQLCVDPNQSFMQCHRIFKACFKQCVLDVLQQQLDDDIRLSISQQLNKITFCTRIECDDIIRTMICALPQNNSCDYLFEEAVKAIRDLVHWYFPSFEQTTLDALERALVQQSLYLQNEPNCARLLAVMKHRAHQLSLIQFDAEHTFFSAVLADPERTQRTLSLALVTMTSAYQHVQQSANDQGDTAAQVKTAQCYQQSLHACVRTLLKQPDFCHAITNLTILHQWFITLSSNQQALHALLDEVCADAGSLADYLQRCSALLHAVESAQAHDQHIPRGQKRMHPISLVARIQYWLKIQQKSHLESTVHQLLRRYARQHKTFQSATIRHELHEIDSMQPDSDRCITHARKKLNQ